MQLNCKVCGCELQQLEDGNSKCCACGRKFSNDDCKKTLEEISKNLQDKFNDTIKGAITDEFFNQQQAEIARNRRNLYNALKKEYLSSEEIRKYAENIKEILPNDVMANFFVLVTGKNFKEFEKYFTNLPIRPNEVCYMDIFTKFLLKSPRLCSKAVLTKLSRIIDTIYEEEEDE